MLFHRVFLLCLLLVLLCVLSPASAINQFDSEPALEGVELPPRFARSTVKLLATGIPNLRQIAFGGSSTATGAAPNPSAKSVFVGTDNGPVYEIPNDGTGSPKLVGQSIDGSGAVTFASKVYPGVYYNDYGAIGTPYWPNTGRLGVTRAVSFSEVVYGNSVVEFYYVGKEGIGKFHGEPLGTSVGLRYTFDCSDCTGLSIHGSTTTSTQFLLTRLEGAKVMLYNTTTGNFDNYWSYLSLSQPMQAVLDPAKKYVYIANNGTNLDGSVTRINDGWRLKMETVIKVPDAQSVAFDDAGNLLIGIRSSGTVMLVSIQDDGEETETANKQ